MKRAVSFLIEGMGYSICMIMALKHSLERFEGVSLVAVFVIPILAFASANLLYALLEDKLERRMHDKFGNLGGWIYPAVPLLLTMVLFFGSYTALEYLGNMPASFRTLLFLSFLSSVIHLLLCEGLRFMGSMKVGLIADDEEDLENDE